MPQLSVKDDLTPSQRAAVEHFEGPLLVLAGPGSGKTRVITRRIARIVERGVDPREILAITFTNKAAREMADRLNKLLPASRVWVSTFHRLCARLLRERGSAVGLAPNFSIYDTGDQQSVIKQALLDHDLDAASFPPAKIAGRISQAKNELLTPEQFSQRYRDTVGTHFEAVVAKVYPTYQKRLLEANAVDFDDLLMHVANLLAEQPDLRAMWDARFRFVLVDEYQDTNRAQYQIAALLSRDHPNLCATGDPDQSIYGWRGAQIANIMRFEQDFPDVVQVRLEQNFRSTPQILRVADELIAHNRYRKPKTLRTDRAAGVEPELRCYFDGRQEADAIAAEIRSTVQSGQRRYGDFAIFYRVNSLSRSLETALARYRVPFQVAGAVSFYERAEIKDVVGYLRLVENPQDRVALARVINTPTRGLGKTTVERLFRAADEQGVSPLELALRAQTVGGISPRAVVALRSFTELIAEFSLLAAEPVATLIETILRRTGYGRDWAASHEEDELQRQHNVEELVSSAREYDQQPGERSLGGFLETASLVQDADALEEQGGVTLMTLHAAKGLEFPCVYLVGVEQNLLPHERSLRQNDPQELEEERRLLFVGITRAEEQLVLTHTVRRSMHGRDLSTIPSDFLQELPLESIDCTALSFGDLSAIGTIRPTSPRDQRDAPGSRFRPPAPAVSNLDDFVRRGATGDESKVAAGSLHDESNMTPSFDMEVAEDHGDGEDSTTTEKSAGRSRWPARPAKKGVPTMDALRAKLARGEPVLTTGAALEAGRREAVPLPLGFAVGMLVRHPQYGLGTVTDVSGLARRRNVTVLFEQSGEEKTFIADRSPLQPVGL